MSAAGLLAAPSKAELDRSPHLVGEPALKTQLIFAGIEQCPLIPYISTLSRITGQEVKKKGRNAGKPLFSACPVDLLPDYRQFTIAQTPSHFARFSSTKLLFEECLVPYYEAMIEKLGLVGQKTIDELKATGKYDAQNPAHQHQACVTQLDVYAVHREKKTRDWIKENFPWMKLLFVPARTTKKLQELDVGVNSHVQSGAKTHTNTTQVNLVCAELEANKKANIDKTPILATAVRDLKRDVFPTLQAGLEHAREVGVEKMAALWTTTGKARAWDPAFQVDALLKHARDELFVGLRKEDTPLGQEMEPSGYEPDEKAQLPAGYPTRPLYDNRSPQQLYVKSVREGIKTQQGLKTLRAADDIAKQQWKALPKDETKTWQLEKDAHLKSHREKVRVWKAECDRRMKHDEERGDDGADFEGDDKDGEESVGSKDEADMDFIGGGENLGLFEHDEDKDMSDGDDEDEDMFDGEHLYLRSFDDDDNADADESQADAAPVRNGRKRETASTTPTKTKPDGDDEGSQRSLREGEKKKTTKKADSVAISMSLLDDDDDDDEVIDVATLLEDDDGLAFNRPLGSLVGLDVVYNDSNGDAIRGKITSAPTGRPMRGSKKDPMYDIKVGLKANRRVAFSEETYGKSWWIVGAAMGHSIDAAGEATAMREIRSTVPNYYALVAAVGESHGRDEEAVPPSGNCAMTATAANSGELKDEDAKTQTSILRLAIAAVLEDPTNLLALAPFINSMMLAPGESLPTTASAIASFFRGRAEMHRRVSALLETFDVATWGGDVDFKAMAIYFKKFIYVILPWGAIQIYSPTGADSSMPLSLNSKIPPSAMVVVLNPARNHYSALVYHTRA
jgi:hypothetical protein